MRIKVSLEDHGEWSDCWLETEYVGSGKDTFRCFIYPTTWSSLYRTDGFCNYMWVSKECPVMIRQWLYDCGETLKSNEINERPLTAMQKISKFFKRIFSW